MSIWLPDWARENRTDSYQYNTAWVTLFNNTINRLKGCNLIKKQTMCKSFPVNFIKFLGKTLYIELFIWASAFGLSFVNPRKKSMKKLVY